MRFRLPLLLLPWLAFAAHCSSSGDSGGQPSTDDAGPEVESDAADTNEDDAVADSAEDTKPDTAPVVITCTKQPAFGTPIRVNHNPDSLRRVSNAGMVELPDGRLMVAMLEALDTSRYGVFARIVDPTTAMAGDDERLDVDSDNLSESSGFQIFTIEGGAIGLRYDNHLRVYSNAKWSPDLAASLPFSGTLQYLASPSGEVLVTRAKDDAPFGQAIIYRPNEGGAKGSWSAAQTLDLDGTSGRPRIDRRLLSDGRFMTLVWQGGGGPSVRLRSLSGAWQAPYPKAEIGALSNAFNYAVLSDKTIVMVALESQGSDTFRATTSTWTEMDNWSTTRLLSKVTPDGAGVIPTSGWPFLFSAGGDELEFVSWVAACAGAAKDCTFQAISRRYKAGWADPVALSVGTDTTGPDGLWVSAPDSQTPVLFRMNTDRTSIDMRVRIGSEYAPVQTISKDTAFFSDTTHLDPRFYGGAVGFWALTTRVDHGPTPPMTLSAVAGMIDAKAGKTAWGTVSTGGFEMRDYSSVTGYADGSGGFTVAAPNATDGMNNAPILVHFGADGGMAAGTAVVAADESSASFVGVPKKAARVNHDRAALFLVQGTPSDMSVTGKRLRGYAWNGNGSLVPSSLAADTRFPRTFSDGLLVFGCGGAVLYAVDPIDGTHGLELVMVKEKEGS